MARQFGVFTIRPDGLSGKKAFQFEASTLGMFRALNSIRSGHALFQGYRAITREVLVFPYSGSLGQCNAYATSDWGMYRNKVSFSPDTWFTHTSCAAKGTAGNTALEVLFHELRARIALRRENAATTRNGGAGGGDRDSGDQHLLVGDESASPVAAFRLRQTAKQ